MATITITARNTFMDEDLASYIMPFSPMKALFGWYSNFWKDTRLTHASVEKIDKNFIRAEISVDKRAKTDRLIVLLPSGAKLDCPFDLKPIDCDVILHHMEGIRLAKFGYKKTNNHGKEKQHKREG